MKKALRGEATLRIGCSKRTHKQSHKQTDTQSQGWLQYSAQLRAQWNKSHLDRPMRKETRTFYSLITDVLLASQNVWYRWCKLQIITRVYSRVWRQQNRYNGQQGQQMHNTLITINMKRGIPRPSDSPSISTRSRCVDATTHIHQYRTSRCCHVCSVKQINYTCAPHSHQHTHTHTRKRTHPHTPTHTPSHTHTHCDVVILHKYYVSHSAW